jgi:glycosyltransferase involved in cell wall biosynthesis
MSKTYLQQGNEAFRSGDYEMAIGFYKKIDKTNPAYKQAEFNIKIAEKTKTNSKSKPILSIIMPVFNVAPYLDASILSVLSQSFSNFELIIINDASTDNSKTIIEMYAKYDNRIKFIDLEYNTLGGAGIPSNIGIKVAQGKYIGFVDSDDFITKDAFQNLIFLAEKNNADVVIGDFNTFDDLSRETKASYDISAKDNIPIGDVISYQTCPYLFRLSPVPWRKLYKKDFLYGNNILYPEVDYFFEDNPLHWFVLLKAERIIVDNSLISFHRMSREGQTMSSSSYKLSSLCCHLNIISNYISSQNLKDKQIVFDEFYDLCYRTDWIVAKQDRPIVANIIKKQLYGIYENTKKSCTPKNIRSNLVNKFEQFKVAYPDMDLTIVIPVYNCADLISKTLESVLMMNKIKYNVLIINDGSTDKTMDICKNYEKKYNNIHLFEQNNKGAGRARNSLMPLITGAYTYFLDADDLVNPQALEQSVLRAKELNNDLLFFKYNIEFFEDMKSRDMFNADADLWQKLRTAKTNLDYKKIVAGLINYPWNRIIKTKLLIDNNIFFAPTVVHNDIPYHWHSIVVANNIGIFDKTVCIHRKFTKRPQITNINDNRRLVLFEALKFTQNQLEKYPDFVHLKLMWKNFAEQLMKWAKDKIPQECQEAYIYKETEFLEKLSKLMECECHV